MIIANFINKQDALVTGLDQYDYGQVLRIQGLNLPTAVEIHFGLEETGGTTTTRIGVTKDGVTDVPIPDSMLENGDTSLDYTIYAFIYLTDETSGKTVHRIRMQVKARSKPELLNKPEDKELFQKAIEAVNQSAKESEGWAHGREDMPECAEDNAKYYSEQASGSAEEVKKVEQSVKDMVATVDGIEQQVQDVKEYAGQAKTAAENALLSEQEAKKSEEASLQHRTGAETAENNAEFAESNAKKSEQAVEQAKQLVMQMGQEVLDNKNYVDGKVEEFGQTVTNANNSIGTKKTESLSAIKTAKTGAVGAVETAGTEQTKKVADEGTKQVKAVEDKGNEVLQSIPEDFTTQMASKLDKNQGVENKGKALVVGDDGNVVVGEVTGGDGIPIINTMSGESPLVVPDSAERVNKSFSIIGNTVQNQDPPPSPSNPQEIKSVGQWNEEKQKYEVDVKVTGKNLLNEEHFFDIKNWKNNQYNMRLQPNTQYVFSRRDNVGYGSNIFLSIKNTKDDRFSQIVNSNSKPSNNQSVKFKTKETGLVWFLVQNNSGINLKDMLGYAQIEVGEISTEHELYKEQTLTLTSERPITKWDKLVEQDGQIGWLYGGKIIESYNSEPIDMEYISSTGELSAGATVLYKLKEAEFVPLPQSEQDVIRALKIYYPTTVITVDGGEVNPDIEVTYIADIKNYIDQKIAAIGKTVVETQKALL